MFQKIAKFFIENSKLTLVLIFFVFLSGIGSYILLPKQYNPTIIVPAFNINIPAFGLTSEEISKIIVSPLENKIMELEGVDEVYGIAGDNYGSVMIKFNVGVDKEKAKIRINQKIRENIFLKPIGVGEPDIQTIDPDELPQIIYSVNYIPKILDNLNEEEIYIYLRQIVNILKDKLKTVNDITTLDIVGGFNNDIIVSLDLQKIEAKNISILQVYDILKKNNLNMPSGDIYNEIGEKIFLGTYGKINKIEDLKKVIISKVDGNIIYLEDIADIKNGTKKINKISTFSDSNGTTQTVFLGIGKKLGTNVVKVTNDINNTLQEIIKTLPKDIKVEIISNEGKKAKEATNMLLINLVESIIIVFIVLALYLGVKNAFNTAISIPLTLGLVFVFALLVGDNINKITLFALILVLGMLVDDSTVVVENMNRHLNERYNSGKTKLEAILIAIKEVELGVILSTVTRLLAFGSMFAVGGMMGEYMGPIPKYAIVASIISTMVALTINPWVSFNITKDIKHNDINKTQIKESRFKLRKKYLNFLKIFLGSDRKTNIKRKIFKISFWLALFIIVLGPIYGGIFKARMLPKSNQDQIYLWIDAPRGWGIKKTQEVQDYVLQYLTLNEKTSLSNNQDIFNSIKNVTSTIGQSYIPEFANLFRGGLNRNLENQISLRINLFTQDEYKKLYGKGRIKSEEFTINLRPILKNKILEKYPDLKISLLEDPPGPPVRSTFLVKIKGDSSNENKKAFALKVENEIKKIALDQNITDLYNSNSSTYREIKIIFDHESISRAGLNIEQVSTTLGLIFEGSPISLITNMNSYEPTNIILVGNNEQISDINFLKSITFTNNYGQKISLDSISNIDYSFVSDVINTDNREDVIYITGEMGDNSLVYPVTKLIGIFSNKDFLGINYIIKNKTPYKIEYISLLDNKNYIIEWGGEWELTLDTFLDLGLAMGISLLLIYFVLVGQFASFQIAGIIMITFLLGFFGVFPGFSLLYLINGEYFSATSMIGVIALAGIVVGNAILLIDYIIIGKRNGLTIEDAILKAGYVRFTPIILTSMTTVFGAMTIIGDPVWSGLAWTIIWGLLVSSILTLIIIPIFYYDSQKKYWN